MFAFILLVVLGGGIGLLAVSLAESPKPATDGGRDQRAPDAPTDQEPGDEPGVREADPEPVEATTEVLVPAAVAAAVREPATPTRRRPDPRSVPRAYTAIEGRFQDVAAPSWGRRLFSLIALVVIAALIGVALAATAAAIIGAIAELVDAAVG